LVGAVALDEDEMAALEGSAVPRIQEDRHMTITFERTPA
jgi:hypothetical protein